MRRQATCPPRRVRRARASAAAAIVLLAAWPASAQAPTELGPVEPAPHLALPSWTTLRFGASKLWLSASTTVTVEQVPAERLAAELRVAPEGSGVPLPVGLVTVLTTDSDLPFGRTERMTVWLDPADGAAIQATKVTEGRRPYAKVFRYTTTGCFVWRSAPADATERAQAVGAWSQHKEAGVRVEIPDGVVVTDPYALLYLVSAARLDRRGSRLSLFILTDAAIAEVDFVAAGLTYLDRTFEESWPGGGRIRKGQVLVRTVHGTARLLAGADGSGVDLGFLGLHNGLTIDLETGTGLPVEVRGQTEHLGDVTVHLDRAVLREPPP
ncbi:MAG: hypothetical protein ACM3O7_05225 [Acidobacteriota bacterium]